MQTEKSKSAAYFDGSCPLCRAEIAHYLGTDCAGALCFVDVSATDASLPVCLMQDTPGDANEGLDQGLPLGSGHGA